MGEDISLWGNLDEVAPLSREEQEATVSEGKIIDIITGDKPIKDNPKEQVRQFIAKALHEQYNIDYGDMQADFSVPTEEKKRRVIDIAIFHHEQNHTRENLTRAVFCRPTPQIGRNTRLRDPEEMGKELDDVKSILREIPSCEYGLWTNGLEFFYFTKEIGRFDVDIKPLSAWPLAGESGKGIQVKSARIPMNRAGKEVLSVAFRRCHNFIHGNEGMSKDAAFWQFLYLIFCKLYDEEQPADKRQFWVGMTELYEEDKRPEISRRIKELFRQVKAQYEDIFDDHDAITLTDRALTFIVSELSRYDFTNSEIDAKGAAYQEIVGTNLRGDRGQYFTPNGVVNMAVEILDPKEDEYVLDPACGTGGFLRETLQYRFKKLCKEYGITPEQKDTEEYRQVRARLRAYAQKYIFGADFDPGLVKAARMQMVMSGDGHGNLYYINSLEFPNGSLPGLPSARKNIPLGTKIEIVMTNPPFGSDIQVSDPHILEQYELARVWAPDGQGGFRKASDSNRRRLQGSVAPDILFLERCMQWLKPGGRMAIVLPDGVLGNPADEYIRYWILQNAWVLASIDLPIECFIVEANVNILTSLLFLKKKTDGYSHRTWWINQSTSCEPTSSRFFRHWAVRTGHLILK
jgi:type I restriction enzyme M protein